MASVEKNFLVSQGTDWVVTAVITQLGAVVDLTGATMKSLLKSSKDDPDTDAVAIITVTPVDEDAGQIQLSLTETQTLALTAGRYYWDIMVKTAGGQTSVPLGGTLTVYTPVTRSTS